MLQMTLHLKLTLPITVRSRILTNQLITRGNNCGKSSNKHFFFWQSCVHHKISEKSAYFSLGRVVWTSLFNQSGKKKCWIKKFWYNCVVFRTVFLGNTVFVTFKKWSIVPKIVWNILPLCRSLVYGFCFSEEQTKKYSTTATSLHTSVPFWPGTTPSRKSWRATRTTMSVRV